MTSSQLVHRVTVSFFVVLGLALLVAGLFFLRSLVVLFFLAFILASALNPTVTWFERYKVPRPLTILVLYIVLFVLLAFLFGLMLPPLISQTTALIASLSRLIGIENLGWERVNSLDVPELISFVNQYVSQYQSIFGQLQNSVMVAIEILFSTFSAVFVFFTLLIATFYLLLNLDNLAFAFAWMLPGKPNEQVDHSRQLFNNIRHQLGSWVSGQVMLMLVIGLITYIGLTLLGVPYAMPLALLAGLLEIVPNVGPTVAAIPTIIIGFVMMNPVMGLVLIAFYILVQQVENNLIVPFIMQEAVDVRPLTTLVVILAGFSLMGVVGALLSVPFYITVRSVVRDLWPDQGPFTDYTSHLPKQ